MDDPKRLLEEGSSFEVELLRSARADSISDESARAITAALGVAAPIAISAAAGGASTTGTFSTIGTTTAASTKAATVGAGVAGATGGSGFIATLASGKILLTLVGTGAVGAAAVWGATQLSAPERETSTAPVVDSSAAHGDFMDNQAVKRTAAEPVSEEHGLSPTEAKRSPSVSTQASNLEAPALQKRATGQDETKKSARRSPAAAEGDSLPYEFKAIDGARRALLRGDASGALVQLDEYSRRFPKPRLGAEATVLRIEALVANGQQESAAQIGRAFLARQSKGPYARRVRSLIGQDPSGR